MLKLFSEWEEIKQTGANERTFRRHREKLKLGKMGNLKNGGVGYYLTEKEFNQVLRSMGK